MTSDVAGGGFPRSFCRVAEVKLMRGPAAASPSASGRVDVLFDGRFVQLAAGLWCAPHRAKLLAEE